MSHTTLTAIRHDTQTEMGDLTAHGLYRARVHLRLAMVFDPSIPADQVSIRERCYQDGQLVSTNYHFLSASDTDANNSQMLDEANTFDFDALTPADFTR